MEAVQTASHPSDDMHPQDANPPSFESVWAALKEVAERQKETDRQMQESAARFDRQMQETDRQMQETDRQMQ
jgi:predicted transcriptional regulator